MTTAEARELCRSLFLETLEFLRVGPHLRKLMRLQDGVLRIGEDSYPLHQFQTVRLISFGKAAVEMAHTATEILGEIKIQGIVVSPSTASLPPCDDGSDPAKKAHSAQWRYFQGGHPYPDQESWNAAEAVLAQLTDCSASDLVLFLISGGGSALLEKPLHPSISLSDLCEFNRVLVTCGATIKEINSLRKHLSAVKGGRLALQAAPAKQVTIYISDVPDDQPSSVASGPTLPDESTLEDCLRIVARYHLMTKFPDSVRILLESGKLLETPKTGHPAFHESRYYCLLSNRDGVHKLLESAKERSLSVEADVSCDECNLKTAAEYLVGRLEILRQKNPGRPILLVSGGELSSPVTGSGRGGRNQAFVLDCVRRIAGKPVVILSAGTDGIDGNSPAAGAIADGATAERAAAFHLDPEKFLAAADSHSFFEKLGDTIVTGPTGTNVRDLRLLLAHA